MDWKTIAVLTFIITMLGIFVGFFVADTWGYLKWALNPSDLICEDCSLLCYLDACNTTEIAEAADTEEIKGIICEVCETCEECSGCNVTECTSTQFIELCNTTLIISNICEEFDLLGTDLNLTFSYYNETGSLITTGDAEFLGEGQYNITIGNESIVIEVGQ